MLKTYRVYWKLVRVMRGSQLPQYVKRSGYLSFSHTVIGAQHPSHRELELAAIEKFCNTHHDLAKYTVNRFPGPDHKVIFEFVAPD